MGKQKIHETIMMELKQVVHMLFQDILRVNACKYQNLAGSQKFRIF